MRRFTTILILLLLLGISNNQFAQDGNQLPSRITEGDIIDNLLEGINSDNIGLKVSCIYYLGERKADKAVIPLMGILKSKASDDIRIVAALSLFKIGDGRGIYAIKQRVEFDESEQVKRMCEIFYNMYLQEQAALTK
ncbi:MAG: hypothetical protein OQJ81_08800 [Melioribacteraceae bacterium]|nr:hypothetical protein [Melioribacteraceae bacterium]